MTVMREKLGQYQILAPLGAGGMGEVYVARDPSLGRKVAIKLLPVRLSGDKETLARFTAATCAAFSATARCRIARRSTSPRRSPTASPPRTSRASSIAISNPRT